MAQRIFQQFVNTIEKATVRLTLNVTATGANNAQTIVRGKGVTSVTQAATGKWTIVLDDIYFSLLGVDYVSVSSNGSTVPAAISACLLSQTVATPGAGRNGGGSVVLQLLGTTGVAAAPLVSEGAYIELVLSNTTAL